MVGLTGIEVMQYTPRERITRMERRGHSLPERRYAADVSSPLITVVAGAGAGAGASMVASVHEGWFAPSLGWAVLMATLIAFFCYLVDRAAGINPRPVTRARLRRLLADTARRLDSDTGSLPLAEAAQMRDSLARVMRVGDRLMHQSQTWRWHEAIRREQRLLTGAVILSVLYWPGDWLARRRAPQPRGSPGPSWPGIVNRAGERTRGGDVPARYPLPPRSSRSWRRAAYSERPAPHPAGSTPQLGHAGLPSDEHARGFRAAALLNLLITST